MCVRFDARQKSINQGRTVMASTAREPASRLGQRSVPFRWRPGNVGGLWHIALCCSPCNFGSKGGEADMNDFMSTRPSVMGPMRSSPPCDRHAAELTLLSVVDAEAATLCC